MSCVLYLGFYNCGWFGGSIPAAFVTFGCSYMTTDWAWRLPLLLQCFTCIIVLASVWFLPESPRYLMANGKDDEAVAFLIKYHGNGDPSSRLVMLEIEEMRENIRQDGQDKVWWDYRPMLFTHNGRWRFTQIVMISVFGQFSGNGLGYFNAAIFSLLGVNTTAQQLGYNVLNSCLSAIGAGIGVSQSDRMPRRTVLVYGTFVCAVLLAINGATSTGLNKYQSDDGKSISPEGRSLGQAALAFYFLFNAVYSFTYTPLQGIIPAEALDTNLRAKGLAASGVIVGLFGFINQYAGPIALKNIGVHYVWVFVAWDTVESLLWWLFWYVLFHTLHNPPIVTRINGSLFTVLSLKVEPSSSWSGCTTSPSQSRPLLRSTRLWSRPMARSPRRLLVMNLAESMMWLSGGK